MKVMQINSVCGIGSTGRIAADIHNLLVDLGHESYIAYGRDLPKNCSNVIKIGTEKDNYIHVAKTRLLDQHGFGSEQATHEFITKVREIDPDIIHLHNLHGYYINIEILFKFIKEFDKPIVWTLHDCWSFTGHCTYFDFAGCDKWKTGCFSCPEKNAYPRSILFDNSKSNYLKKKSIFNGVKNLTIVTPSQWLADLVKDSFISDYSVNVINNGIDLNVFKPTKSSFREKYNLQSKFILLGVASNWDRRKGLKYFLEMSNKLNQDEIIVLVGLSDAQMKNIPDNIIGISKTNNVKELAQIYSSSDVFVNPTLEDNFPTTNLEAIACGTPVVTFNTGGSPETIDTDSGIVVEKGNIEDLLKAISKIKHSKLSRTSILTRAKLFDKNRRFNDYIDIYKNSLSDLKVNNAK